MPEKWDILKDTVRQVEETRPGIPSEKAEDFVADTAGKVLEMLPDLKLPIPPPRWLLPDMTPTELIPPVPICTPGDEKCIGPNWCRCNSLGTAWDIITPNATECEVPEGTAILYGTVTDIETGAPIGGISVDCDGYTDTTAPDGTYRITGIPAGVYTVTFTDTLGRYQTEVR